MQNKHLTFSLPKPVIRLPLYLMCYRSTGIATSYGLDGRVSIPGRDRSFFFSIASRPWSYISISSHAFMAHWLTYWLQVKLDFMRTTQLVLTPNIKIVFSYFCIFLRCTATHSVGRRDIGLIMLVTAKSVDATFSSPRQETRTLHE
jgi:hypothetical protein